MNPNTKTIKLIYGGKPISEETKKEVIKKAGNYNLNHTQIILQQGFAVGESLPNLNNDSQQQEINRLKAELVSNIKRQDSIESYRNFGGQLIKELQPIFPEVKASGIANVSVFNDTLKSTSIQLLFLKSNNPTKTIRDKERIKKWFQSRVNVDSVEIFGNVSLTV